jgi:hypothetical protein
VIKLIANAMILTLSSLPVKATRCVVSNKYYPTVILALAVAVLGIVVAIPG